MPESKIVRSRPDIWKRAIQLAHATTGYQYYHKAESVDGTLWACGGGGYHVPVPTSEELRREIDDLEKARERLRPWPEKVREYTARIRDLKKKLQQLEAAPHVFVPEGDMEWLLHEVGHYFAANPSVRKERNYGLDLHEEAIIADDREVQAMAWEQIVMAPFGEARSFVPPLARYGVCFERQGPIPARHLEHIARRLTSEGVDIEPWRLVWGEWVKWGRGLGDKSPWSTDQ